VCSRGEKLSIGAEFVFGGQHCDSFDSVARTAFGRKIGMSA
jgi:hypothetical protein